MLRDIDVPLRQRFIWLARSAEKVVELVAGHAKPGAVVEIGEIKPERPVLLYVDEVIADEAARSEARHKERGP